VVRAKQLAHERIIPDSDQRRCTLESELS
ncbi:unnamed protein product, partial [Oikopleura dioica]